MCYYDSFVNYPCLYIESVGIISCYISFWFCVRKIAFKLVDSIMFLYQVWFVKFQNVHCNEVFQHKGGIGLCCSKAHHDLFFVHWAMGCDQTKIMLVWHCYLVLSGFLANYYLSRESRQSNYDKAYIVMPGAVPRSPDICLRPDDKFGKTSARR